MPPQRPSAAARFHVAARLGENPISAPEVRGLATRDEPDRIALHRVQPLTARRGPRQ
jgi:hypothetical protein